MEENRKKIHILINEVNNPGILENLLKFTEQYIKYYSIPEKKNEEEQ